MDRARWKRLAACMLVKLLLGFQWYLIRVDTRCFVPAVSKTPRWSSCSPMLPHLNRHGVCPASEGAAGTAGDIDRNDYLAYESGGFIISSSMSFSSCCSVNRCMSFAACSVVSKLWLFSRALSTWTYPRQSTPSIVKKHPGSSLGIPQAYRTHTRPSTCPALAPSRRSRCTRMASSPRPWP